MKGPVEFRELQGLLSLCRRMADAAGVGHLWGGPDGLGEIAREKLIEWGIPEKPVPLTPRGVAEGLGVVKRRRAKKCTG